MAANNVIIGTVTMIGENTNIPHLQCGETEVVLHNAPNLKVGDEIVATINRKVWLTTRTVACYATNVTCKNNDEGDFTMAAKTFRKQVVSLYDYSDDYLNIPTIVTDVTLENKSLQAAKLQAAKLIKKYELTPVSNWKYISFSNDYKREFVSVDDINYRIMIHHFSE